MADAGLALLQHLGYKLTLAVMGDGDIHIHEAGTQPLVAVPVAAVVGIFVHVIILAVAPSSED